MLAGERHFRGATLCRYSTLEGSKCFLVVPGPIDVLKTKNVEMIDLRFTDLPGTWQHFSRRPQNPTGSKTTIDYSARD
jgi:hypothetical protein